MQLISRYVRNGNLTGSGVKISLLTTTNSLANELQLFVYKSTETKRYDFVTNSAEYAADIVRELKKGISPYREV